MGAARTGSVLCHLGRFALLLNIPVRLLVCRNSSLVRVALLALCPHGYRRLVLYPERTARGYLGRLVAARERRYQRVAITDAFERTTTHTYTHTHTFFFFFSVSFGLHFPILGHSADCRLYVGGRHFCITRGSTAVRHPALACALNAHLRTACYTRVHTSPARAAPARLFATPFTMASADRYCTLAYAVLTTHRATCCMPAAYTGSAACTACHNTV